MLVALADQPLITEEDVTSLIGAFKKLPADTSVLVPRVAGAPGNPVIFTSAVRATDNRRFTLDLDTPEDIESFERLTGHALRWPAEAARAPDAHAVGARR